MFANMSLKVKMVLGTLALLLASGAVIGGLSLQQFSAFSNGAIQETYAAQKTQGLLVMQTGTEANLQRIERLIDTTHDTLRRLAASFNLRTYLKIEEEAEQTARQESSRAAVGLLDAFRLHHAMLQQKVDESLEVADYVMRQYGDFMFSSTQRVQWEARNQVSGETLDIKLPQAFVGTTPLLQNFDLRQHTPVVDDVKRLVRTTCTIFQRMNPEGDMLRIATSVVADGQRATGTYIPALNPDGTPNSVIETVLRGETYRGRSYVVDQWHISAYTPLRNDAGDVTGMLYVGVPLETRMLEDTLLNVRVGSAGYAFAVDTDGTILIHPRQELVGRHIVDDLGLDAFAPLLNTLSGPSVNTMEYTFEGERKYVTYVLFPKWNWVLCIAYSQEEITQEAVRRAREALMNEMRSTYRSTTIELDDGQEAPLFTQIRFITSMGDEDLALLHGEFVESNLSKADTAWFQDSITLRPGDINCCGVIMADNTGAAEMRALSAVYIDEIFRGLIVVNMDWDLTWKLLEHQVYGESGYAYILNDDGVVITHPRYRLQDQVNVSDEAYGDLAALVQEEMLPGHTGTGRYTFEGVEKFVAFAPLRMMNRQYVMAVTTPVDEFFRLADGIAARTTRRYRGTAALVVGVIMASMLGAFGLVIVISRSISHPVERVMQYAQKVSAGDLSETLPVTQQNEIGTLLRLINTIVESLRAFLREIQRSTIQVTSSATELSATAQQQKVTVAVQVQSIDEVSNSVKEISDVTENLTRIMHEVAEMSQDTATFASSGQQDLTRMKATMHHMEQASKSISTRLEAINEKAGNITNVVTTINKVADQTNLLSLNASIEAEKAGEYGRGFTVVAREIRRLADQTAISTLDIDHMVKEMQSAVSSGVMEMDKFIQAVHHSVDDVARISEQLARIIEQVQVLSPRFDDVNVAMEQQSQHAQSITTAMMHLSEEMQETSDSLNESFMAIEQMNEAVHILQNEVSRFKV